MDAFEILRLISASLCGMQIGSYLLLSLLNRPLLQGWPTDIRYLWIFKRFYRLNTALAVIAGVIAVLGKANQPGVILAVLGMSHVIAQLHLLRAIQSLPTLSRQPGMTGAVVMRNSRVLFFSQQLLHLGQIFVLIYVIYRLI